MYLRYTVAALVLSWSSGVACAQHVFVDTRKPDDVIEDRTKLVLRMPANQGDQVVLANMLPYSPFEMQNLPRHILPAGKFITLEPLMLIATTDYWVERIRIVGLNALEERPLGWYSAKVLTGQYKDREIWIDGQLVHSQQRADFLAAQRQAAAARRHHGHKVPLRSRPTKPGNTEPHPRAREGPLPKEE
jgi:hypothetical protein